MVTARDIMTADPHTVGLDESAQTVARLLADNDIGGVIVCDSDRRPTGMVTDRDLAVGVLAAGKDPATKIGELLSGAAVVTIDADASLEDAAAVMRRAAVRRLPVVDERGEVVGIISQADMATHHQDARVGDMVADISEAPDNTNQG